MKKKIISILLIMIMVMGTVSTFAFAEGVEGGQDQEAVTMETNGTGDGTDGVTDSDSGNDNTDPSVSPDDHTPPIDGNDDPIEPSDPDDTTPIAEPTSLTAAAEHVNGAAKIKVIWSFNDETVAAGSVIEVTKDGEADESLTREITDSSTEYTYDSLGAGSYVFTITATVVKEEEKETYTAITEPVAIGEAPAAITNFNTFSACKSVVLEWDKPAVSPDYYEIWSDGKLIATLTNPATAYGAANKYMYKATNAADEKTHKYYIVAYNGTAEDNIKVQSATKSDQMVLQMYVKFTFKQNKTLTSHDGKNKKRAFKKGQTYTAIAYAKGQYRFYCNGNLYYVNYTRTKSQKALYTTKFNYSNREAEYFVNTSGNASMTKYLIWVNLYTQHLYVFQGSKGNWTINKTLKYKNKLYNNWEISSGKASTPTVWGLNNYYKGKLTNIYNKKKRFPGHGASLWNFFFSEQALHGPAGKTGYGAPHSHGCVRNPLANAQFIFNVVPKKTRVIIY